MYPICAPMAVLSGSHNTAHVRRGLDIGAAHGYCQWQACLWSASCLNNLLLQPLPQAHMTWLFSGSLVHGLLKNLSAGRSTESLLGGGPLSGKLYCTLLDAVRDCSSITPESSGGGAKRNRRRRGGRGRGRGGGGGEGETDLKVGYGICETPAEFENKQLKWSYPLSFNADSDSTHAKYLNAQSCTSANTDARERARLA